MIKIHEKITSMAGNIEVVSIEAWAHGPGPFKVRSTPRREPSALFEITGRNEDGDRVVLNFDLCAADLDRLAALAARLRDAVAAAP